MQKLNYTLLIFLVLPLIVNGQFVEISYESGYSEQAYYRLSDDATTNVANTFWDIAFTNMGLQDAGVLINEATASSGVELELYQAPSNDFSATITSTDLTDRLYNSEDSWENGGAFNSIRVEGDPFDYGWGSYNPTGHIVEGTAVYVIKLRDGSYKKLEIQSLASGVYSFRYADLDGSNEASYTIDKAAYPNDNLIQFSFDTGTIVNDIPATTEWDLLFTRYVTPLDDGTGNFIDYAVSGVLSGVGVEVAQANGVDPANVEFSSYEEVLTTALDEIGYDWKSFDLGTFQWSLPSDRAYFVKTANGAIWKIVFIDFEGSSTGNAVFEKTQIGLVNSNEEIYPGVTDFAVFPNPVIDHSVVTFTTSQKENVSLNLYNAAGQLVWQSAQQAATGFNVVQLPAFELPQGLYWLQLNIGTRAITKTVSIAR